MNKSKTTTISLFAIFVITVITVITCGRQEGIKEVQFPPAHIEEVEEEKREMMEDYNK